MYIHEIIGINNLTCFCCFFRILFQRLTFLQKIYPFSIVAHQEILEYCLADKQWQSAHILFLYVDNTKINSDSMFVQNQ